METRRAGVTDPAITRVGRQPWIRRETMALPGIEIFKLLAKTNCKECGFPTCLAFAMALASGKAELDACPYVSDEVKEKLSAASAPPIRPIKLQMKDGVKAIGGETVMFRHEKTFFNPTVIAGLVTTAAA